MIPRYFPPPEREAQPPMPTSKPRSARRVAPAQRVAPAIPPALKQEMTVRYCDTYNPVTRTCSHVEDARADDLWAVAVRAEGEAFNG